MAVLERKELSQQTEYDCNLQTLMRMCAVCQVLSSALNLEKRLLEHVASTIRNVHERVVSFSTASRTRINGYRMLKVSNAGCHSIPKVGHTPLTASSCNAAV